MPCLLIIPILNKEIKLLKGPLFAISETIQIQKINDSEHSAFFRYGNKEINDFLIIDETKCLKVQFDNEPTEEQILIEAYKLNFLLNIFGDESPLVIRWAAILEGANKLTIKKVQEFEAVTSLNEFYGKEYKIKNTITRQAIFAFYKRLSDGINSDPNSKFTIRRFNSSLLRSDFNDKLIDATICLESIISGTTELNFKFSLYLSFLFRNDPDEKNLCFQRLKDLYDVRSRIVHGEIDTPTSNRINTINQIWSYYDDIIRSCLTYYLIYISNHTRNQWKNHLLALVLGTENKIIL